MRSPRPASPTRRRSRLRAALLGGGLAFAALAAAAQGEASDAATQAALDAQAAADALGAPVEFEPELLPSAELDRDVLATMPPGPPVLSRALLASAVEAALHHPVDPRRKPIVPATAPAVELAGGPKPLGPVDPSALATSQATLRLIPGQFVQVHADGLPGPAAPSTDPFVRVLPLQVDPNAVKVGARWGSEDRIDAPLLSQIALSTQADLFAGPAPRTVRRSLRISAQWDSLSDLTFGLTPGVQRIGGGTLEHYVAGLQASTLDPHAPPAHWRSFIEVSGEKISPGNLIENSTAQVHAGATYASSNSTQLDFSVTRGTMYQSDLTSSVGLQVKF
ncbi:MAG: hypothetical protein ACTHL8_04020 [Burkholderiaceae bacterium]